VIPHSLPGDMTAPARTKAVHTGVSDGSVTITIVDPVAVTGDNYEVGFKADDTWYLVNTTDGDTLLNNQANQSGNTDYEIVDGLLVTVVGPSVGVESVSYTPSENRWLTGYAGYEMILGADFFGSTTEAGDYRKIEVRFSATNQQKAAVYRRDKGYAYEGVGTFPGTVWDITSEPDVQLMVAFVEEAKPDLLWNPEGAGDREYLFIGHTPYNDDDTSADWDIWKEGPSDAPSMLATWPQARADSEGNPRTWTEGDVWAANPYLVNTPNDKFAFTTQKQAAAVAATDLSKILVVPNPFIIRHELMPNTDNPAIMFTNVPSNCDIRIYTLAGDLVDIVKHRSSPANGTAVWDVRNSGFQRVSSGLYLFHVDDLKGKTTVGKFAVVR